ncbi:MAG: DUF4258 domain-containing protein [Spirochaetes bacterium]|nr:DUF4258 domain-containing protein [Spirochaetota bacterium]
MNIRFSRHALRRIKLYGISEFYLKTIIECSTFLHDGRNEIVHSSDNFQYPIKVVINVQDDYIMVITAYPLKRRLT